MGAQSFVEHASGDTAKKAFRAVVDEALYQHGHGGYSGTIAEKNEFVMVKLPEGKSATDHAYDLNNGEDSPVDDKWGPAGCLPDGPGKWVFFGWASS